MGKIYKGYELMKAIADRKYKRNEAKRNLFQRWNRYYIQNNVRQNK